MRGWIYIISNKSMPGLVKVGYSGKDPEDRASELDNTGAPHPYVVEYDVLIEGELFQVEQHIHQNLSSYSEGKEWFRCTPEQAVIAIRQVVKEIVIAESFKKAAREKAERLERERQLEIDREQEKRRIMSELMVKEREMDQKYEGLCKKPWSAEQGECRSLILKARTKAHLSVERGKIFEDRGSYSEALYHYNMAVSTFSNVSARLSELEHKIRK